MMQKKQRTQSDRPADFQRSVGRRSHRKHSRGFTIVELLVSITVLGTVMTVAATIIYKTDLIWRDIARHRVAMAELNNQLESLTLLRPSEIRSRIDTLEPSELCRQTLLDPALTGELIEDPLGHRLVLRLNWRRIHPGTPVQLVAWLTHQRDSGNQVSTEPESDQ